MTRDEILAMPAGREMDALVAEKVMGYRKIADPSSEWFIDRNWRGLADDVFWVDSLGVMTADINGYRQWRPSTDIGAAWEVVEKMQELHHYLSINTTCDKGLFDVQAMAGFNVTKTSIQVFVPAPLAICRAALLAVMEAT